MNRYRPFALLVGLSLAIVGVALVHPALALVCAGLLIAASAVEVKRP